MPADVFSIFLLFSVTVIIGYVGSLVFEKTRVPDVIWLLIFGMLVSFFGFADKQFFLYVTPLLAALAVLLILFDAGMNMDFYKTIRVFPRSFLLAILGMFFSMAAVAAISMTFFGFDLLRGLLLGAIVGGTSASTVIGITKRLRIKEETKLMMNLEAIITDPLVIVVSIALVNMIIGTANSPVKDILSIFSIGAVIGLVSGIIWLFILERLKGRPFDYMLTLAVLFLLYVTVEINGGSGAIASLAFGLVLGNGRSFSIMLRLKRKFSFDSTMRNFQAEITFFIRSFFFVFLGIIIVINQAYVLYGIAIAIALVVTRLIFVHIGTFRSGMPRYDRKIIRIMAPRDLAAAVVSQFPAIYGIEGAEIFSNIVFVVILVTVIYTTVFTKIIPPESAAKQKQQKPDENMKVEKSRKPLKSRFA